MKARANLGKSILLDTILAYPCTIINTRYHRWVVATRQNSSSGRPKSPRVQVVLTEDLCEKLSAIAELESRTVSNMAKVLIQEGLKQFEQNLSTKTNTTPSINSTEGFRSALEAQKPKRLRGAPRRLKIYKSSQSKGTLNC